MTQTLRRELRKKFEEVLVRNGSSETGIQSDYWQIVINELADAALEVSAIQKRADLAKVSVEAAIFGGLPVEQETIDKERMEREATSAFETAWGITRPWDWWNIKKDWRELLAFVVDQFRADSECFKRYVSWYDERGKFEGGKSAPMIQRDPTCFYAAWDMFKRQDVKAAPKSLEDMGWK
jgi:hypothetical protein